MMEKDFFDKSYYENGPQAAKSLYQNYRWMPELTIPLAHHIIQSMGIMHDQTVMDFGCAKGFLVNAMRLLGIEAYGVDVSEYAVSQIEEGTRKWCGVIKPQENLVCAEGGYDWILCKDILEHIPYDKIDEQLKVLRKGGKKIMAMIPLGDGEKYIIESYEHDKSHFIREDVLWWHDRFEGAGFHVNISTKDMGPFKKNWQKVDNQGNCLIVAERFEDERES